MIDMTPEVFACEAPAKGAGAARAAAMAALVPQIETARLTLRAPRAEDFPLYAEILCSDRGRYMGGPFTRDEAWSDFTRIVAAWLLRGHGAWTVEVTETGRIAGFVLLGFEPGDLEPELGVIFRASGEGQGFATEAAIAARDFAFGTLGWQTLVSYIAPANARSIAVATRLGAVADGEIVEDGEVTAVYRYRTEGGAA